MNDTLLRSTFQVVPGVLQKGIVFLRGAIVTEEEKKDRMEYAGANRCSMFKWSSATDLRRSTGLFSENQATFREQWDRKYKERIAKITKDR